MGCGRPPRVALITPSLKVGGLEGMIRNLATRLDARGYPCEVFTTVTTGVFADSLARASIRVHDCGAPRPGVGAIPTLVRSLASFNPAVIHAHSGTWMPAAVARRILREPCLVFTDHGRYAPEPRKRAWIERWVYYQSTDRLVAVSPELARYIREFLRLPAEPEVIPNGIDLAPFQQSRAGRREELRRSWSVSAEDVVVVTVGRLEPVKDHATLLRAFSAVADARPEFRLVIIGRGRRKAGLERLARELGIDRRVRFLGYRSDIPECLAAADIYVSTSLTEGQPIALLEAMAARLAIVATAVGGVPQTVGEPPAAVLVAPGEVEELHQALASLAKDRGARTRLARRAWDRVQQYSLERCVDRYCEVYAEVLEERAGASARPMTPGHSRLAASRSRT